MLYFFIILSAIIALSVLAGAHLIFLRFLSEIFPLVKNRALLFGWLPLFLTLGFIVISFFAFRYNNLISRWLYWFFSSWLGYGFYLILAALIFFLFAWIFKTFDAPVNTILFGQLLFAVALIVSIYGIANSRNIVTKELKVGIQNLPESWRGRHAVWISDVHLDQIHSYGYAEKLAGTISAINPDILFIGGDYFDGSAIDLERITEPFTKLKPPLGTFFITGNHEEFGNPVKYLNAVKNAGMTVLDNRSVDVDGLRVIGVDYKTASDSARFEKLIRELTADKSKPMILLKHEPKDVQMAADNGIAFEISGHTHRFQMFPLGLFPWFVYGSYYYGLHQVGSMVHYTSDGVGTWGPPLRVGTSSEIVIIEFISR